MFGIESVLVTDAIRAKASHEAEKQLMKNMTPEEKEKYIDRKEKRNALNLRRREIAEAEAGEASGYGPGALFLAFLFGSHL